MEGSKIARMNIRTIFLLANIPSLNIFIANFFNLNQIIPNVIIKMSKKCKTLSLNVKENGDGSIFLAFLEVLF